LKASECSRSRTYIPIPTRLPHRTGRSSAVRNGGRSTSGPDRDYKWATPRDRSRRGTRKGRSARRNEPVRLPWAEILQRSGTPARGAEAVMRGRLGGTRGRRGKSRRKQRTFRAPRYIDLLHAWRDSPAEREFRRAHEMCADEGKRFARHAGGGPARRPRHRGPVPRALTCTTADRAD